MVTGDAYRDTVGAMTAVEHFGTDYLPLERTNPPCLCDAEPGVFAVFSFAVLALHQVRVPARSAVPVCSCGQSVITCPVQALARDLLFATESRPTQEAQS